MLGSAFRDGTVDLTAGDRLPAVGVDVAEARRIAAALDRWGEQFLRRVFTDGEPVYCGRRIPQLTARFAAKEAVAKALGTGMRGIGWREIEVVSTGSGRPTVVLHGRAHARARQLGISHLAISLSHTSESAIAFVVAT